MAVLVRMHTIRQMIANEQGNIPVPVAQELPHIFAADVCIAFSKAWSPLLTDSICQPLEQEPLLR